MTRLVFIACLVAGCGRSAEPKPAPRPAVECASRSACSEQCSADVAESCALWAGYFHGSDNARALELSQRACDMGEGLGCQQVAELYGGAHGFAADSGARARYLHRAGRLYRRQCDSGDGKACYLLAGLPGRSPEGHERLLRAACQAGYQPGCE